MAAILWEDDDIIALDKPPGQHSAPLEPGEGGSLLEEVLALRPGIASLPGRKAVEPGLLHRLDAETSGIVLVAKTEAAFRAILEGQEEGLFRKEYLALCAAADADLPGALPPRIEPVDALIRSSFRAFGPGRRRVAPLAEGEGRVYETRILGSSPGGMGGDPPIRLFRVGLDRGFRHQVRVHLAWIGWPILGDRLYAPSALKDWSAPGSARGRLMLHAWAAEFIHPRSGEPLRLEAPPPPAFAPFMTTRCGPL